MTHSPLYDSFQFSISIRTRVEKLNETDQAGVTMPLDPGLLETVLADLTRLEFQIEDLVDAFDPDAYKCPRGVKEELLLAKTTAKKVHFTLRLINELKQSMDSCVLCQAEEAFISLSSMDLVVNLLARAVFVQKLRGDCCD